jgi:hypothetical protein
MRYELAEQERAAIKADAHELLRLARKQNPDAPPATNQPDGQIGKTLSIPSRKKIPLPPSGKSVVLSCPSHPKRGALRTSRTLRWDAVDAGDGEDERLNARTAKSCGPGAPTLASSSREARFSGVKVARKPGHLGEREVSRKPLRRESRRCSGSPVVLPPCFLLHGAHECDRHPAFPAPSA